MEALFSSYARRKNDELRFSAGVHGINLDESGEKAVSADELPEGITDQREFVFGDPSSYEKMSMEEREALTEKMMANWGGIAKAGLGGKTG